MKALVYTLTLVVAALATRPAEALVAICKEPEGRLIGYGGDIVGKDRMDREDAIKNGVFTFTWRKGAPTASIIAKGSGSAPPREETGQLLFDTDEQVTFAVAFTSAVYMYSVFPKAKRFILTAHTNGLAGSTGGAMAKVFDAGCDISE